MMTPRKFFYCECHYFGMHYLVEWDGEFLGLQVTSPCIPFLVEPKIKIQPTESQWVNFRESIKGLQILKQPEDDLICDGFDVDCHISFYRRQFKFNLVNPSSRDFECLRDSINTLTICDQMVEGIFYTSLNE